MYETEISQAAAKWGVPETWIQAVIQTESSWNTNAYNANDPGGARGLMQVIASTARAYGVTDLSSLFIPSVGIDVGTHLLHDLRQSYGEDFQRVYSAYNSGKPDLWQTSAQVAAHVQTAMANLASWTVKNPGVGSVGVLLLLIGYLLLRGKKK